MLCKKCNSYITESALKCNNCKLETNNKLRTSPLPSIDMYGNRIMEFFPDENKKQARKNYLISIPVTNEYENAKRKNNINAFIMLFLVLTNMLFFALGIKFLSMIDIEENIILFLSSIFIFIAFTCLTVIVSIKIKSKNKPNETTLRKYWEHNPKSHYYFNDKIIGYSIVDHRSDSYTYYTYYEIDKNDIKSISYDSNFAEYILFLKKPVYTDYNIPPTTKFIIADIFEESVLTAILNTDLPPRYMPF